MYMFPDRCAIPMGWRAGCPHAGQNAGNWPAEADRRRPGDCRGGVLAAARVRGREARASAGKDAGGRAPENASEEEVEILSTKRSTD